MNIYIRWLYSILGSLIIAQFCYFLLFTDIESNIWSAWDIFSITSSWLVIVGKIFIIQIFLFCVGIQKYIW